MTKSRIWFCTDCVITWNNLGYALDACPECGGDNLKSIEMNAKPIHTEDSVTAYIEEAMSQADGYIASSIECWQCDGGHYMVWPGRRDKENYTNVTPLLELPRCPIVVWRMADPNGIGLPLNEFLKRVEIER